MMRAVWKHMMHKNYGRMGASYGLRVGAVLVVLQWVATPGTISWLGEELALATTTVGRALLRPAAAAGRSDAQRRACSGVYNIAARSRSDPTVCSSHDGEHTTGQS